MINDNNRFIEFDMLKGITILAVILGHSDLQMLIHIIFVFHMPCFFLISGYFLSFEDNINKFIEKKAKRLLIPYALTCSAICFLSIPINFYLGKDVNLNLKNWIYGSIYGAGTTEVHTLISPSFIGALWFLWALFWGLIIVHYIVKRFSLTGSAILIILLAYVGWKTASNIWLPWNIQAGLFASLFIFLGFLTRRHHILRKPMSKFIFIFCILITIYCIIFFKGFWMVNNYLGNGLIDIIGALAATYLLYWACYWIKERYKIFSNILFWYCTNILFILCLHIIELDLFPWIYAIKYFNTIGFSLWEVWEIIFAIKICYVTIGSIILNKIKENYFNIFKKSIVN